ncbi:MAG: ribonuclease HII [Thermoleophilia bacterium]|nr:ribonuclease HII [Thermoleophilia bacterium]
MPRAVARRRPSTPASRRLFAYDRRLGGPRVAGVDEVGRGCLAGPLVVAGVVIDHARLSRAGRRAMTALDDSKRMTAEARYRVADAILRHCPVVVVVSASSATIDRDGLHVTNQRLLREVAHRLAPHADVCLVDGRPVPEPMPAHIPLVGGDGTSAAVAAASVVAKTARDRMMRGPACAAYPDYGFGAHVGYATATHRAAVRTHGPCPLHRRSFASLAYAPWPGDAGPGGGDGDG